MGMEFLFFAVFGVLLFLFIQRVEVSDFLFEKLDIYISTRGVTYILIGAFVLLFTLGTLYSDQKEKYSHISSGYDKMRPKANTNEVSEKKEEPHRWFNINFDIFKF